VSAELKTPSQKFIDEALYIVDASSYIFRAYYGLQAELTAPDGTPTHATYAFVHMIRSLASTYKTKNLVLIWDRKEPSFRKEIYKEYKANRSAPPEDLSLQIENTVKLMKLWGYPQMSAAGYEADDIIAALTKTHKGPVVVVTADKDLLQLVNERVWCLDTMKKKWSNENEAKEKFGVEPARIADVQAIMGDSSDNIPGAPGIGPKGAADLIQHFGSLTAVLAAAKARKDALEKKYDDPLTGRKLKSVAENIELIELSYRLVSLDYDAPVESMTLEKGHYSPDLLAELKRLNFKRLADEIEKSDAKLGTTSTAAEAVQEDLDIPIPTAPRLAASEAKYIRVDSLDHLKKILKSAEKYSEFAFDTETVSLDMIHPGNICGLSFCFVPTESYYVPLRHKSYDGNLPPAETLKLFEKLFAEKTVIFHNGKFDWHQLANENLIFSGKYEDTILASFLLDVTGSHNLENLSERYLGVSTTRFSDVVQKGENFSDVPLNMATHYAAEDAYLTLKLWQLFKKEMQEKELFKLYEEVDRPLARVLFEMERTGVKLDKNYLNVLYNELEKERFKIEEDTRELLKIEKIVEYSTVNFASTKQLAKILFIDLKLPIIKEKKTGPSTDVEVLEELSTQHPFPKLLLEIRELSKLLSTYIQPLPQLVHPDTERLHTSFSQTIAQTGRLASSEPNLQNIPIRTVRGNRIRKAFIAEEGYSLYSADYSQIELRFLAEFTHDPELTRAFKEGVDIHTRTAALIFNKKESDITPDERRSAKTINFGIIYGQTPFGLSKTLGIPRGKASEFIESYFKNYPKLKVWMESVVSEVRQSGLVKTMCGRIRNIPDINSKNPNIRNFSERTAVNSPLQGSSADLIKIAMIRVRDWIKESGAPVRMVLQIHDELLFEVKKGFEKTFEPKLREILEDPKIFQNFTGKSLQIPLLTDHGFGPDWGQI
jgi:DNA polymerase-1